ncbi:MAG: YkgJ family cysteine cluster protein [Desulforhabdus sp.]|nr:YkgJ family cysteine cluster protein [Desulforhabdus sp.]
MAATVFDVIGAAAHGNKTPSAALQEGFALGLLPVDGQDRIVRVALKVKKPCPHLTSELCTIYEVRPLACMLFPERSMVAGRAEELSRQEHFRGYLCIGKDFEVSKERVRVIRTLTGMLQQEILISDCYLFGCSPFFLDLQDLLTCSVKQKPMSGEHANPALQSTERFTIQQFDTVLLQLFGGYHPFSSIQEKIAELEDLAVQQGLLESLQDKRAVKRCVRSCYDSQRLFRPVPGGFKAKRMSLVPSECRFL